MTGTTEIRSFLALEMPAEVREAIAALQQALRRELPDARWVRPEGIHLTVKFLGERPRAEVLELAAELDPRLAGLGPVSVAVGGTGFFPSETRPRVAWVGGRADGAAAVVREVEEAAAVRGWNREARPWSPHLTLARLRRPWPRRAVERFLAAGRQLRLDPFRCDELVLFRSTLGPGGARYDVVSRMSLT